MPIYYSLFCLLLSPYEEKFNLQRKPYLLFFKNINKKVEQFKKDFPYKYFHKEIVFNYIGPKT